MRRFLAGALLLLALLVATFVTLDFAERVDDFLDRGATTRQILGSYYHYVPDIIRLTSPLALFLSAVYVTARLAQSMQLTALQMAGVSTWRYLRPFLIVAVLVTVAMIGFNGWVVPRSTAKLQDFQNEFYRDAPDGDGGGNIYRQVAPGVIVTARYFDREQQQAFQVSVVSLADSARGGIARRLDANQMTWSDSLATWQARDVTLREFDGGRETFRHETALDTAIAVLPRDLARSERDAERLTLPEARDYVASLKRAGVTERGRQGVAYHTKVAYPFANLVLVLLAVPLAARRRRGGQAVQLALGLGVAFIYLAVQKTVEPLGYVQTLPPAAAAWLPHVAFGVLAAALLVRADR